MIVAQLTQRSINVDWQKALISAQISFLELARKKGDIITLLT